MRFENKESLQNRKFIEKNSSKIVRNFRYLTTTVNINFATYICYMYAVLVTLCTPISYFISNNSFSKTTEFSFYIDNMPLRIISHIHKLT